MVLVTADVDAQEQLDALLVKLNAPLGALDEPWPAYDLDRLPNQRPDTYVGVSLYRRPGGGRRSTGWAATTQLVSTDGDNARLLHKIVTAELDHQRMTVDGRLTSEFEFITEDPISEDDEHWNVGTLLWHYIHGGKPHA